MGRTKKIDRSIRIEAKVPESIASLVNLELYSDIEGKIPHGKVSELVTQLFREWLEKRGLKL